jgi:hypothetical protein
MTFVSQTEDTWDIPVDLAVEVMQEIWDAIGTYEYEITTSIPVYHKYVVSFGSKTKLRYIFSDGSTLRGLVEKCYRVQWHHVPSSPF